MNFQDIIHEEYDTDLKAQKVSLVSAATVYAVVSADIVIGDTIGINSNVTLNPSKNYIGLVSVSGNVGFAGNVTLDAGSKTQIVGNVTLSDSKSYIGLVSVSGFTNPLPVTGSFYQATQPVSFGNVTISDSKGFIGLVTAVPSTTARTITGNLTLSNSKGFIGLVTSVPSNTARTITGNLTLSDSKGYIGLVSVSHAAWSDPKTFIGLTTSTIANQTLYAVVNTSAGGDPKTFIGLTTSVIGSAPTIYAVVNTAAAGVQNSMTTLLSGPNQIGSVTVSNTVDVTGSVTFNNEFISLSGSEYYIGLVTVANTVPVTFSGNVTLDAGSKTQIVGNLTLSDPKGYIGLVTSTMGNTYASNTIFQGIVSGASGVVKQFGANTATWLVAKADNSNATTVFVGPSLASVNVSFPLDPGEAVGFSISNSNLLFMCGTDTFSSLRFTGGN